MKPVIKIDQSKCTKCMLCVNLCPVNVFTLRDNIIEVTNADKCILCYGCVPLCPSNAISVEDIDVNVIDEGSELKI